MAEFNTFSAQSFEHAGPLEFHINHEALFIFKPTPNLESMLGWIQRVLGLQFGLHALLISDKHLGEFSFQFGFGTNSKSTPNCKSNSNSLFHCSPLGLLAPRRMQCLPTHQSALPCHRGPYTLCLALGCSFLTRPPHAFTNRVHKMLELMSTATTASSLVNISTNKY